MLKRCRHTRENPSSLDSDQDSEDDTEAMLVQQQDDSIGELREDSNNEVGFDSCVPLPLTL